MKNMSWAWPLRGTSTGCEWSRASIPNAGTNVSVLNSLNTSYSGYRASMHKYWNKIKFVHHQNFAIKVFLKEKYTLFNKSQKLLFQDIRFWSTYSSRYRWCSWVPYVWSNEVSWNLLYQQRKNIEKRFEIHCLSQELNQT